jgi:hypothetical protein
MNHIRNHSVPNRNNTSWNRFDDRIINLETEVSSINTKIDNMTNDVSRLTDSIDRYVSSSKPQWGVISSFGGVLLAVVIGYYSLATRPYDLGMKNMEAQISVTKQEQDANHQLIIKNLERIVRLEERSKIYGESYHPVPRSN